MSEPYDPYIPSGGGGPNENQGGAAGGAPRGNDRTKQVQQELDQTLGIMKGNLEAVSERGARLDSLRDKTDNLAASSQGFRRGANKVRKQMWWKEMKMKLLIGCGILILLIIIVVPIVVKHK